MRKFRLYGFSDGRITVITRGENEDQAMRYATRDTGKFPKGVTVFSLNHLPINANKLYDTNHDSGWLYRAPAWLQKEERETAEEAITNAGFSHAAGAIEFWKPKGAEAFIQYVNEHYDPNDKTYEAFYN